jgi:hypothetical protein
MYMYRPATAGLGLINETLIYSAMLAQNADTHPGFGQKKRNE